MAVLLTRFSPWRCRGRKLPGTDRSTRAPLSQSPRSRLSLARGRSSSFRRRAPCPEDICLVVGVVGRDGRACPPAAERAGQLRLASPPEDVDRA